MNFEQEVIIKSRDIPVLTVFSTSWCGPCRMLKQTLSTYERKDIEVKIIDVDQNSSLAQKYQIRSVPTLILFNIGKPISRVNGALSHTQLNKWLDTELPVEWTEIKGS